MSLLSEITAFDTEGVKFAKLQRWLREAIDNAGISYALVYPLTDINVSDSEGIKWVKLGAWMKLLADNISSGGGGTPGGVNGQVQYNNAGAFGGLDSTGTGDVVRSILGTLEGFIQTGAKQVVATTLAGTEIDVTLPETIKVLTVNATLTFSNATPATGTTFNLTLTADASGPWIATIPSTYDLNRQGNITTITVPANATIAVPFKYTGAAWQCLGPSATVGSGAFVLAAQADPLTFGFGDSAPAVDAVTAVIRIPWACTADSATWAITARGTNPTCTVDILRIATGTTLPSASFIGAGTKPALAAGNAATGTESDWDNVTFAAGDLVCAKLTATNGAGSAIILQLGLTRTS